MGTARLIRKEPLLPDPSSDCPSAGGQCTLPSGAHAALHMLCTLSALLLYGALPQPASSDWLSTHNREKTSYAEEQSSETAEQETDDTVNKEELKG